MARMLWTRSGQSPPKAVTEDLFPDRELREPQTEEVIDIEVQAIGRIKWRRKWGSHSNETNQERNG